MSNWEDLRGKPAPELKTLLDATREELFKMRFAATTEPVDHPNKIQEARKRIARIQTRLRQLEIQDAQAQDAQKRDAQKLATAAGKK